MFPELDSIAVISFDIWMTLMRTHPDYKPARVTAIREQLGLAEYLQEEVSAAVHEADREIDKRSDKTGVQYGPAERLREIADMLGISVSADWIAEAIQSLRAPLSQYPPLFLEADLLDSLALIRSTGRKIILTSNTGFIDGAAMRAVLTANGILPLVDGGVFSNEIGVAKPHVRMFEKVSRLSGAPFGSIMHVGDNLAADYEGARSAGVAGCLLSSDAPAGITSVTSIAELATLLAKIS